MAFDERQRHEIAGGVVEIDVPEAVEQGIVARAEIVEGAGRAYRADGRLKRRSEPVHPTACGTAPGRGLRARFQAPISRWCARV